MAEILFPAVRQIQRKSYLATDEGDARDNSKQWTLMVQPQPASWPRFLGQSRGTRERAQRLCPKNARGFAERLAKRASQDALYVRIVIT